MTLIAALVACLAQPDTGEQFFKFPAGTRWTYAALQGEQKSSIVLTLLRFAEGAAHLESRQKFEEEERVESIEWGVTDGIVTWSQVKDGKKTPVFPLYKVNSRKDDRWKVAGSLPEAEYTHAGTAECKVAAGIYRNAVRVQARGTIGEGDFHLAPGIGLVRIDLRSDGKVVGGMELTSFGLGGAVAIDLSTKYNAKLDKTWHPVTHLSDTTDNDLVELPAGHQVFAGTSFNAAGVVQLASPVAARLGAAYPQKVEGIGVGRACAKLHFLHAAGWSAEEGAVVGKYVVTYADGEKKEIPIAYGEDLRDWWFYPDEPLKASKSVVAWTGKNKATVAQGMSIRLFKSTWENPSPTSPIKSIDYVSTMTACAPFLVGLTAEPAKE